MNTSKLFTKNQLVSLAEKKGHDTSFIEIMTQSLFDYASLREQFNPLNPVCSIDDLRLYIDMHCGRSISEYELDCYAESFGLEDGSEFKMYDGLLYTFIANLVIAHTNKKEATMNTYKMIEKQHFNCEREGVTFQAKSLTGAKIAASRRQCFYETIIELQDETGHTLAVKEKDGSWIEQSPFK